MDTHITGRQLYLLHLLQEVDAGGAPNTSDVSWYEWDELVQAGFARRTRSDEKHLTRSWTITDEGRDAIVAMSRGRVVA